MELLDALGGLLGADEPAVDRVNDPGDPPIPVDTLREAADRAASEAGFGLDFTLASLDRLDGFAAERDRSFENPEDADAVVEDPEALGLGAYFGEVLIREFGGAWEYQRGWTVHLGPGDDPTEVPAFEVAAWSLVGQPTFRKVADAAARELAGEEPSGDDSGPAATPDESPGEAAGGAGPEHGRAEADGAPPPGATADGAPSPGVTPDAAPSPGVTPDGAPAGRPPDERTVTERYRRAAEQLVGMWPERGLDGSVVSLVHLDRLLAAKGDAIADHDRGLETAAGYFAEVLRRRHGATWTVQEGAELLVLSGPDGSTRLDPYVLAAEALAGEASFVREYAEAAADCGLEPPVG